MIRRLHALACTAFVLATAPACSKGDDALPRRPQGLLPGEEVPRGPTTLPPNAQPPKGQPPPPPRSSLPSPFLARAPDPGALRRPDAGGAAASAEATPAADAGAKPERDLAAELAGLVGAPAQCVDLATVARGGGRLTITLSATVVPSGRITRASASAPGQPTQAVRCLEQRLAAASFRGPVEGAPRSVTTTVPIEVVSQAAPEAAKPPQ